MKISFNKTEVKLPKLERTRLKNWIADTAKKHKRDAGELSFTFMSDEELLRINKEFLNHNTLTDIITFDYSEDKTISGEIYISVDRVRENAAAFNVEVPEELRRVIIHGVLHLCGYGDKSTADKKEMRKLEEKALQRYHKLA